MTPLESYTERRFQLAEKLPAGAVAIVQSNDVYPGNGDGTLPYRPNSDLYMLSGIKQEDCALLLFPHHPEPTMREILFIKHVDDSFVKWHGRRHTKEEAEDISGIETIFWHHEFEQVFRSLVSYSESIYLNLIEHPRSENITQTRDQRLAEWCAIHYPLHPKGRLAPILGALRAGKNDYELGQIKKACEITGLGFRRMLKFVKPGVREKQIEAELIHEYMQHDGAWADYEPIFASGNNTCILHYISNHNTCREGELLLSDAAASYNLYNSDLSRTIPVNGKYSRRQKEVYQSVLSVHKDMKSFARAGINFAQLQKFAEERLIEQLGLLNLCDSSGIGKHGTSYYIRKYCYHEYSHYLGLDVHDAGHKFEALPENAVITIEPGIYIEEEGIGVRIENNIVLKKDGYLDLMADIPVEAEEIEDIMKGAA